MPYSLSHSPQIDPPLPKIRIKPKLFLQYSMYIVYINNRFFSMELIYISPDYFLGLTHIGNFQNKMERNTSIISGG